MSKRVSFLITDSNVTVNYDGETHIVKRSDGLADKLIKALKENRLDEIPNLVSVAKRVETFSNGAFAVKNGRVQVNGVDAPQVLSDKIVKFANEGLPFQPLLKFAEKLSLNPSFRAVNELYSFLEKNDHPITESGNFICYKRVSANFMDIHSGTFDNSVGNVVSIPRNQVDEDCNKTCSTGLHVSSWDYAHTQYGSQNNREADIMLEVEVNPADVVAVPVDYNNAKMRVCSYTVLGVVTMPYEPSEFLRIINQEKFDIDQAKFDEQYDGEDYCEYCGEAMLGDECENYDCTHNEDVDFCDMCGEKVYDSNTLCDECEYDEGCCGLCGDQDCYDEACQDKPDDDEYPYEDEFKRE